jgi:hypothetical protein
MSLGHGETVKSAREIDNHDVVEALAAASAYFLVRWLIQAPLQPLHKIESLMPPMSLAGQDRPSPQIDTDETPTTEKQSAESV